MELATRENEAQSGVQKLAKIITAEVLPSLKAYYPKADFIWRGNMNVTAKEYAEQLFGIGVSVNQIRLALASSKDRSSQEHYPPNPIEFRHMVLNAKGMPTLEQCIEEIEKLRTNQFGTRKYCQKLWSHAMVYWLSARTSGMRTHLTDASYQKLLKLTYTKLADKFAKGELEDIPLQLEHKVQPAYIKYMNEEAA